MSSYRHLSKWMRSLTMVINKTKIGGVPDLGSPEMGEVFLVGLTAKHELLAGHRPPV